MGQILTRPCYRKASSFRPPVSGRSRAQSLICTPGNPASALNDGMDAAVEAFASVRLACLPLYVRCHIGTRRLASAGCLRNQKAIAVSRSPAVETAS